MKVEFLDSEVYGPHLFVSAIDFYKANDNEFEFESLAHATEAFSARFAFQYSISLNEYNAVMSYLEKNGAVLFIIAESHYPTNRWCEIIVSNDNKPQRVTYMDEEGFHVSRRAKLDPKAMERIRKRHEKERLDNE